MRLMGFHHCAALSALLLSAACTPGRLYNVDDGIELIVDSGTFDGGPGFDGGPRPDVAGSDAGPGVDAGPGFDGGPPPDTFDAGTPPENPLAPVTVQGLSAFQTVEVHLVQEGSSTPANAPLIAGRDAVFRATVAPDGGFSGSVEGRLTLTRGADERVFIDTVNVTGTIGDLPAEGFLFEVPGEWVGTGVSYVVSMHTAAGGGGAGARFPGGDGTQGMGAVDAPAIEIHLVPLRYNADGSGRLPAVTTPSGLALMQAHFAALLPTANVILEVIPPVDLSSPVSRLSGGSWSAALQAVQQARSNRGPSGHVYFLGLVAPAATANEYCGGACIAGLGSVNTNNSPSARSSVALGFERESDLFSALHEVGHNFGLPHAPCGQANGTDPSFPYGGGLIGVWGFDQRMDRFVDPGTSDLMGYCRTKWVSDYNYNRYFDRAVAHGDGAAVLFAVPHVRITLAPFRAPQRIAPELEAPATVEEGGVILDVFDADGNSAGQVIAHRQELSIPGIVQWLVPLSDGVQSVELPGGAHVALRLR